MSISEEMNAMLTIKDLVTSSKKPAKVTKMLTESSVPFEVRKHLLAQLCHQDDDDSNGALTSLLDAAASGNSEDKFMEKKKELEAMIAEMEAGALRYGICLKSIAPHGWHDATAAIGDEGDGLDGGAGDGDNGHTGAAKGGRRNRAKRVAAAATTTGGNGGAEHVSTTDAAQPAAPLVEPLDAGPHSTVWRAKVLLSDGDLASCVVPNAQLAQELRRGDAVWIEPQGKAVLFREREMQKTGEEGRLERLLDGERVEITLRDQGRFVFHSSDHLLDQLDAGEAEVGSMVIVSSQSQMAFGAVPEKDEFSHFEYIENHPVPDVSVERDIGSPPRYIEEAIDHILMELENPGKARRYNLRRALFVLLEGVSGSGKTYSILGLWRRLYELLAAHIGVSIDELPPRVMRLRCSRVLSKWLGESDKRIDRFFDEVEELAVKKFIAPDGVEFELPVLVVCEEIDGIARARGEDAVYDRIQTNLLQRLDPTSAGLSDKLVVVVCTTNVPQMVDSAFLRRVGGYVEHFGRLGRRDFLAVIEKHVRDLPFSTATSPDADVARHRAVSDVAAWLFNRNGTDQAQVEITYVGSSNPVTKYRRDFLTAGLVDRAVQQASREACADDDGNAAHPGLNAEFLMRAFDEQVRHIVDQLQPQNAINYITLPDGVRVNTVRRLEQSSVLPIELERAS